MECKHTNLKKSCDGLIIFCQDCRVNLSKDIDFDKIVNLDSVITQTRWASDDPIEKILDTQYFDLAKKHLNRVHELEEENKLLKSQLAEIHQANVRLNNKVLELEEENKELKTKEHELKVLKFQDSFNRRVVESITNENVSLKEQLEVKEILNQDLVEKVKELEKELKDKTKYIYKHVETKTVGSVSSEITVLSYDEYLQTQQLKIKELEEQLETKEIINQDLAKKYQILQEEIDAYDINMLELVEDYKKLEQDYNELQGKYNSLQEYAKNSSNNLFKVNLQHKVKPYLSEGVINVIVESNKEFK